MLKSMTHIMWPSVFIIIIQNCPAAYFLQGVCAGIGAAYI